MGIIKERAESLQNDSSIELGDSLLEIFMQDDHVSRKMAMNVPTFAGCINKISDTVSTVPIYLYRKKSDGSSERIEDRRVRLINCDTGDTLSATDLKKAIVKDYYINKGCYIYINRYRNEIRSIHYVDPDKIAFLTGTDAIFKEYRITCDGRNYHPHQFVKILRNSHNGWRGVSIIAENAEVLSTAYNALRFENTLVKKGGNKRGFLETQHKLNDDVLRKLKDSFRRLYASDSDNVIALNEGVKFVESSESSTEMQLNENKKSNAVEICKLFNMPPAILNGGNTEQDKLAYIQYCIIPILNTICNSFNRDMLLEKEKKSLFFAPDTSELLKADIKTRYDAYATGYKNGFLQLDDIRKAENMPTFNVPFIKMGLQDVLYNPESGGMFTPNMGLAININDVMDGRVSLDDLKKKGAQVPRTEDQNTDENEDDTGKESQDEDNNKS